MYYSLTAYFLLCVSIKSNQQVNSLSHVIILTPLTDSLCQCPTPVFCFQGTFDTKDATASAHAGITQATAYYPYDPALGQYQYDRYVVRAVQESYIVKYKLRTELINAG